MLLRISNLRRCFDEMASIVAFLSVMIFRLVLGGLCLGGGLFWGGGGGGGGSAKEKYGL